jgi:hypothetical protein
LQHLLGALTAFAALRRDPQPLVQLTQAVGPFGHLFTDLNVGNPMADANVHAHSSININLYAPI